MRFVNKLENKCNKIWYCLSGEDEGADWRLYLRICETFVFPVRGSNGFCEIDICFILYIVLHLPFADLFYFGCLFLMPGPIIVVVYSARLVSDALCSGKMCS